MRFKKSLLTPALGLSRRGLFKAAGAFGLASAGTALITPQEAKAQSTDWTQPGNNNHVIGLQEGVEPVGGAVNFDFYGHCALKITSPGGLSMMFDPWHMLVGIVYAMSRPEQMSMGLAKLGKSHAGYGVKAEHYPIVLSVLLEVIKECLGSNLTESVENAWQIALTLVTDRMKNWRGS